MLYAQIAFADSPVYFFSSKRESEKLEKLNVDYRGVLPTAPKNLNFFGNSTVADTNFSISWQKSREDNFKFYEIFILPGGEKLKIEKHKSVKKIFDAKRANFIFDLKNIKDSNGQKINSQSGAFVFEIYIFTIGKNKKRSSALRQKIIFKTNGLKNSTTPSEILVDEIFAKQNTDGSIENFKNTFLAVRELHKNKNYSENFMRAVNFLLSQKPKNTKEKAQILTVKYWRGKKSILAETRFLLTEQNMDGGFGVTSGYASDFVTSMIVLNFLQNFQSLFGSQKTNLVNFIVGEMQKIDTNFYANSLVLQMTNDGFSTGFSVFNFKNTLATLKNRAKNFLSINENLASEDEKVFAWGALQDSIFSQKKAEEISFLQNFDGFVNGNLMATIFALPILKNSTPKIEILSPVKTEFAHGDFEIKFAANDNDDALISLFFASTTTGARVLIAENIPKTATGFVWNFSGVTAGEYFIFAEIDDGFNTKTETMSDGKVMVTKMPLRFVENGDGTVRDAKTGLEWMQNANLGFRSWSVAKNCRGGDLDCENGTFAGKSGWRIPTKSELLGIFSSGGISLDLPWPNPFLNIEGIGSPRKNIENIFWTDKNYARSVRFCAKKLNLSAFETPSVRWQIRSVDRIPFWMPLPGCEFKFLWAVRG